MTTNSCNIWVLLTSYDHTALLSFIAYEGVNLFKREREQNALVMLVRIQPTDLVFSSADLSTTRGAIEYLLAIFCLLLDEHHAELLSAMYADLIKQVDSGQLSPGTVEMMHKTAKETAEGVHTAIEQAKARELPVQRIVEIAYGIKDVLREHLRKIQKIMLDVTDAKKIESIRNALARIEGQDRRNRKSDSSFDVVK